MARELRWGDPMNNVELKSPFMAQGATLKLVQLEGAEQVIKAQFNPKELQIDTAVQYQDNNGHLEFTKKHDSLSTLAFELFFDGFETKHSVVPMVIALQSLTKRMEKKGDLARPPKVRVIWGEAGMESTFPCFTAVVESVSVKYTMFGRDGQVLRATANIKLKECGDFRVGKAKK
jgi:hypothetical protein